MATKKYMKEYTIQKDNVLTRPRKRLIMKAIRPVMKL